ncbi:MAG: internal scaffolding protein [Microviridae sp.]|nr:MAG: internal scaffolding protein [Microviridae sp.]
MKYDYRVPDDEKRDAKERKLSDVVCLDESLTVQGPAQDADINVLVRRFGLDRAGIPPAALDPSYFGDFSEVPVSLQDAMNRIAIAQRHFDALPPGLRARFRNDPAELWEFVNREENYSEAVKLGLLRDLEAEAAAKAAAGVPLAVPPGVSGVEASKA